MNMYFVCGASHKFNDTCLTSNCTFNMQHRYKLLKKLFSIGGSLSPCKTPSNCVSIGGIFPLNIIPSTENIHPHFSIGGNKHVRNTVFSKSFQDLEPQQNHVSIDGSVPSNI